MRPFFSPKFTKQYNAATEQIRVVFDKQLKLMLENFRHPSLQTKLFDDSKQVWQGRVTQKWRFYFKITGDIYEFVAITKHPK